VNSQKNTSYISKANFFIFLIGLLFAVLAGEAGLRVFLKDKIVLFPRYHSEAVYGEFTLRRLRPNTTFWHTSIDGSWKFVTNSQGFRNYDDFEYEKDDNITRVVTLGDSMTQGFEVPQEKTYSAVIEQYLTTHGIKSEVMNMGVSGFSTAEALIVLQNEVVKYHPDYVVLGFYGNDYEDNIKAGLYSLENGELVVKKKIHIPGVHVLNNINEVSVLRWLSENSYLYSFALNTVWNVAKRLLLSQAEARLQTEFAVSTENVDTYKLKLAERLLQEMHRFCQQNNIHFIILDIPKPNGSTELESSISPEHLDVIATNSDQFVKSTEVLKNYLGSHEFHVPHGQRHISTFTHQKLGEEVGRVILEMNGLITKD